MRPGILILKSYIRPGPDDVNRFAYSRVSAADMKNLDTYIDRLAALPISTFNRQEQFAYWINLYNALTIQVVATHYPVGSIREIDLKDGSSSDGPWEPKILEIEAKLVSTISSIGSCVQFGRIRAFTMPSIAPRSAVPTCDATPMSGRPSIGSWSRRPAILLTTDERFRSITATSSSRASIFGSDRILGLDDGILAHLRRYAGPTLKRNLPKESRSPVTATTGDSTGPI